ncbi:outer mitochondrial membrane protein porin [Pyricularia oryzae]|uniref:Outer mitochondrial membrane protein porin n=2 Tax=Pyricularia oryzae TaxID=318829 RepID=A0AA97P162_PYRO3|nr:outer mitochondrial membrane protein porin [Pyricularia oryzae Y34]KAI6256988.1 hypothetical protein MCOR19_006569 [Pyricularia oryzae]KAI6313129.1 hypothetical protein MCOR34_005338 [Pyricularia oryzae]KAI6423662.1 hypothetical protein MCOR21_008071 [Pyricularia oryzae]KAI6466402.1 hypothetical protein MCOR18_009862 [Pyricularia oryzae]
MSIPNFEDITKSANDLLTREFYHLAAGTLEVKSKTPNNVDFKVKGKSTHEGATSGSLEGKFADKSLGTAKTTTTKTAAKPRGPKKHGARAPASPEPFLRMLSLSRIGGAKNGWPVEFAAMLTPTCSHLLMIYHRTGLTLTQSWNTANALESKLELNDTLAKGLKLEGLFGFLPATSATAAKLNLHFKQSNVHGRAFFDLLKGPTANVDAVIGHEGFLAGLSGGYNVQKAAITTYSAAVGYSAPQYTAAVTATDNASVFAASYYHKVNSLVEAGAKASWNSKIGNSVGLEVATKYRIDPLSFVKGKINDRGVAAVAYTTLLRPGVTFGIGASFDTQKLDQATHKVGTSFTFES